MTTGANLGTIYPTKMPDIGDTADIQMAFKLYHFGTTDGSESNSSGITGYLYGLKNNPVFNTGIAVGTAFTVNSSGNIVSSGTAQISGSTSLLSTLAVSSTATFGGNVTINSGNGTVIGNVQGNLIATTSSNGKVTFSNTSTSSPGTYTQVGKIFVQSTAPDAAIVNVGDLWFW